MPCRFFELFEKYGGYKKGHLKLKKPKQLQEVLDIARDLLCENPGDNNPEVQEKKAKLRQLKLVLEMYVFYILDDETFYLTTLVSMLKYTKC